VRGVDRPTGMDMESTHTTPQQTIVRGDLETSTFLLKVKVILRGSDLEKTENFVLSTAWGINFGEGRALPLPLLSAGQ